MLCPMTAMRAMKAKAMRARELWPPLDPLGEALHFLRMTGTFYVRSELTAPWGLTLPAIEECLSFHVVNTGRCWLEVDPFEPVELARGDLALVPHGRGHRLTSEPGASAPRVDQLPHEMVSDRYGVLRLGGGGAPASLVCGMVRFDHPAARHLIDLLPHVIRIDASSARQTTWMESSLHFMAAEAEAQRPGGEAVITRLADILVIQAIRWWIQEDPAAQRGWLGALKDPSIGRAISLIHRDPARPWTLAALAREVAMSRSAFAARFSELVGEPAMHYLARWRMHVALAWLEEDGAALGQVASRLGYQSEASFSRAFKRLVGVSPGAARQRGAASRAAL